MISGTISLLDRLDAPVYTRNYKGKTQRQKILNSLRQLYGPGWSSYTLHITSNTDNINTHIDENGKNTKKYKKRYKPQPNQILDFNRKKLTEKDLFNKKRKLNLYHE